MNKGEQPYGNTTRLEAYTDGVFAIASTLLVLDLSVDALTKINSSQQLWLELGEMRPKFFSFVLSFLLLSMLWIGHVQQFRQIKQVDTGLMWVNSARLMFLVLIPFSTAMSSEYSQYLAGKILLPINIFLAILFGYLTWLWAASRGRHLLKDDVLAADIRSQQAGSLGALSAGALCIIASIWVGPLAFLFYALGGVLSAPFARLGGKGRSKTQ